MPLKIIAWHDRNSIEHDSLANENLLKGYIFISLSIYGEPDDPRYAAILIHVNFLGKNTDKGFYRQTLAEFQQTFNDLSSKGFGPFLLSATGPANNPLIASVFRPMQPTPLTRLNISETEMRDLNVQAYQDGQMLHCVDTYGDAENTRYVAVWHPNPSHIEWNFGDTNDLLQNALNDSITDAQQRYDALTQAGARLKHIAFTPKGGILQVYTDETIGSWTSKANLNSQEYQATVNELMAQGLTPVHVCAQGTGSNARFGAIFATRIEGEPRVFRSTGPDGMVSVDAIDKAVEMLLVKNYRLHGASIAIVKGTRLVYVKGYTWAGSSYPDVLPTTFFRQASVSKLFTAIAVYRWMELHQNTTLETTMQSILNLTPPPGLSLAPGFEKITLRHLLESTSGLEHVSPRGKGVADADLDTRDAYGSQLPVTPLQLASYGATIALTNDPGDPTQVHYGNAAYFYLSLVLSQLYQTQDDGIDAYENAIKKAVMVQLHMSRVRSSRSLISVQEADEARYHLAGLPIGNSVREESQPWVAWQYGGFSFENYLGGGGLSAAVTDVARLVAMLNAGEGNPLLKTTTIKALMKNASDATKNLTGPNKGKGNDDVHGYHGWDGVTESNNIYYGGKGGWLWGDQSQVDYTTGGFTYIQAINGNAWNDGVDWLGPVKAAAEAHEWGSTDLFPEFNMPPLPPSNARPFHHVIPPFKSFAEIMQMLKESVTSKSHLELLREPTSQRGT